jgi:hypothetical protein
MSWRKLVFPTEATVAKTAIGNSAIQRVVGAGENFTSFFGVEVTGESAEVRNDRVRDGGSDRRRGHCDCY